MSATTYLTISGVNKRFGGLQALRDCSFSIGPGKIICLVGPNGAGKTTVFNAITGFLKADSGEVSFKEHRLTGKRLRHLPFTPERVKAALAAAS